MFDVGFLELMLIGIVALVVIGPERLPDVARTAGTWINKAQRFVRGVKSDIASELKSGELKDLLGDQRQQINELRQMVQSTKRDLQQSTSEAMKSAQSTFDELEESAADAGIVKPRHSALKKLSGPATDNVASDDAAPASGPGTTSLEKTAGSSGSGTTSLDKTTKASDAASGTAAVHAPEPAPHQPASPAVSPPVNSGPRAGSWASGAVRPDASTADASTRGAAAGTGSDAGTDS